MSLEVRKAGIGRFSKVNCLSGLKTNESFVSGKDVAFMLAMLDCSASITCIVVDMMEFELSDKCDVLHFL